MVSVNAKLVYTNLVDKILEDFNCSALNAVSSSLPQNTDNGTRPKSLILAQQSCTKWLAKTCEFEPEMVSGVDIRFRYQ